MSTVKNAKFDFVADKLIEHQDSLYKLAYTYVRDENIALDVVQEAACKALKSASQLKDDSYVKTWLCRIVINESKTHFRKNKHLVLVDDSKVIEKEIECEFMPHDDLYQALDTLDATSKTIVLMRYFEDLPFKDIAKSLSININTVKSKLYKSLERLKLSLKDGEYNEK